VNVIEVKVMKKKIIGRIMMNTMAEIIKETETMRNKIKGTTIEKEIEKEIDIIDKEIMKTKEIGIETEREKGIGIETDIVKMIIILMTLTNIRKD
jgi:hypothetical protein